MKKVQMWGKGGMHVTVVADSLSEAGVRLTSLALHYPRFIHAEMMTHRVFSRNASSSRAIPVTKMNDSIMHTMAMPIHWGANQPGMQAREEHTAIVKPEWCGSMNVDMAWQNAGASAVDWSQAISDAGYHKQICNRITEPFQFIDVIITATEWENFFALRIHHDAQPEIAELATIMEIAIDMSEPDRLAKEQWHLPYVDKWESLDEAIKCSVARCARVSYKNHDQTDPDVVKDIALHDRLLASMHMSPFEHVAKPMEKVEDVNGCASTHLWNEGTTHMTNDGLLWSNNFRGWVQYRALLDV